MKYDDKICLSETWEWSHSAEREGKEYNVLGENKITEGDNGRLAVSKYTPKSLITWQTSGFLIFSRVLKDFIIWLTCMKSI